MGFLARTAITAFAFWCAAMLVGGVSFSGPFTLVVAAIVFGVVNALIRPVLILLSLPLNIITLGLFTLVVNAAVFGLTALLMPGMRVASFGAALLGALVVALVSWIASRAIGGQEAPAR
ncbi:phage holin family protein [Roseomonas sp. GC11]|uniref:phage holin family protein n=1 Tax=Roseomonas sp. GC11 TaxID=2950546 RepID=UPI00210CD493|nr:phage holin family protein [Roseomonas sp. GC11]MCQ4161939.1 phage holin family protein [Roseomonas sp. GC11]